VLAKSILMAAWRRPQLEAFAAEHAPEDRPIEELIHRPATEHTVERVDAEIETEHGKFQPPSYRDRLSRAVLRAAAR
jgi:hypothetical protein